MIILVNKVPKQPKFKTTKNFYSSYQVQMLSDLNLADNLMGKIPFVAISHIKSLKHLDLSNNRIEKIEDPFFQSGGLRLDKYVKH